MLNISSLMFVLILVSTGETLHRDKRFVVFPRSGSSKVVIGIGVPLKLGSKQSMAMGWNLQMQYSLPTNVTQLQQFPPDYDRKLRDKREIQESDRSLFYKGLEDALNGPDYGNGEEDPYMDPVYVEAQRAGEYGVKCPTLYTKCSFDGGLLGLISIVDYGFG